MLWCPLRFASKYDVRFVLTPIQQGIHIQHDFHILLQSCHLTGTQQVPLGEQEILFPIWNFQWALGCPIFSFLCSISSTIVLSVFLLFVIILCVLLRLWHLIDIYKLFLISICNNYLNTFKYVIFQCCAYCNIGRSYHWSYHWNNSVQ